MVTKETGGVEELVKQCEVDGVVTRHSQLDMTEMAGAVI